MIKTFDAHRVVLRTSRQLFKKNNFLLVSLNATHIQIVMGTSKYHSVLSLSLYTKPDKRGFE